MPLLTSTLVIVAYSSPFLVVRLVSLFKFKSWVNLLGDSPVALVSFTVVVTSSVFLMASSSLELSISFISFLISSISKSLYGIKIKYSESS